MPPSPRASPSPRTPTPTPPTNFQGVCPVGALSSPTAVRPTPGISVWATITDRAMGDITRDLKDVAFRG